MTINIKQKSFCLYCPGLDKLNQTEVEVKQLQIELAELKPLMEQAAEETRQVIQQIATDTVSTTALPPIHHEDVANKSSDIWSLKCTGSQKLT